MISKYAVGELSAARLPDHIRKLYKDAGKKTGSVAYLATSITSDVGSLCVMEWTASCARAE